MTSEGDADEQRNWDLHRKAFLQSYIFALTSH